MIKNFLKRIIFLPFPLILIIIGGILAWKNYTPGTSLIGWDTLQSEFNLPLNISRSIFGVWRQEQGLGALAGHSHMADLPRILLLYAFSFVFPLSFLRYLYFFLCLILGPLGTYFFLNRFVFKEGSEVKGRLPAFLGGLFYLLNLGTLQHFYVPFEMFTTLYAFLPWLLLTSVNFIKEGKKKSLVWFCFLTFLALPMAYAATLWYVYFAFFLIFITGYSLWGKFGKEGFKKILILVITTLAINSFWLLPNFYFFLTSANNVTLAKMNLLFSPKAFAYDSKFADIGNAAFLKGFLFGWLKYKNNGFSFLLGNWLTYLKNPVIGLIGVFLSLTVLFGAVISVFRDNKRRGLIILPGFIFSFIFLIHETPVLSSLFLFLRNNLDIFKEGLRFPWTKFSVFVIFGYSVFFALGIEWLFQHWLKKNVFRYLLSLFLIVSLIFWVKPAFEGQLISPELRLKIPPEYFQAFSFFNSQPKNERIALLPAPSTFGWEYYRWGFEGAGFWWFGLDQSFLTRDFDRWNPQNENFYWEISQTIYSKNESQLEKVLEKFEVNWLILDKNMISPDWPKAGFSEEIEKMISSSPKFSLENVFGEIKIYRVNLGTPLKDYVYLASNLASVNSYEWGNNDKAFEELGDYASTDNLEVYYPFRSIFTGRKSEEITFEIEELKDKFIFKTVLPKEITNYELIIPPYKGDELVSIDENDLSKMKYLIPVAEIKEGKVEVAIPKATGLLSAEIDPTKNPEALKSKNCNQFNPGKGVSNTVVSDEENQKDWLRLEAQDANNCSASFYLPNLMHQYGYLIGTESRNISGKTLLFWLENLTNWKADLEVYLPKTKNGGISKSWFIQPPMAKDGLGYTLHFDNISIGKEKTVNDLGKISVYQIPYKFLTGIKLQKNLPVKLQSEKQKISVLHPNPSLYKVQIDNNVNENTTLVLSQSYHQGWKAYEVKSNISSFIAPIFGQEIKEHVLVNNWENGWILPENFKGEIVIIFWPQYLEYLGFGILGATLILIIFSSKTLRKTQ